MVVELTVAQARRIAVRAQALEARRPGGVLDTIRRLTFVKVDPVSAIAPNADVVLWSRLREAYDPAGLATALESRITETSACIPNRNAKHRFR